MSCLWNFPTAVVYWQALVCKRIWICNKSSLPSGQETGYQLRITSIICDTQIDKCFGFETSVERSQGALMAAKTEARSARRGIGLVKLMGRSSGFIAMQASMASGMNPPAGYQTARKVWKGETLCAY